MKQILAFAFFLIVILVAILGLNRLFYSEKGQSYVISKLQQDLGPDFVIESVRYQFQDGSLSLGLEDVKWRLVESRELLELRAEQVRAHLSFGDIMKGRIILAPVQMTEPSLYVSDYQGLIKYVLEASQWGSTQEGSRIRVERRNHLKYLNPRLWNMKLDHASGEEATFAVVSGSDTSRKIHTAYESHFELRRGAADAQWFLEFGGSTSIYGRTMPVAFKVFLDREKGNAKFAILLHELGLKIEGKAYYEQERFKWEFRSRIGKEFQLHQFQSLFSQMPRLEGEPTLRFEGLGEGFDLKNWFKSPGAALRGAVDLRKGSVSDFNFIAGLFSQIEGEFQLRYPDYKPQLSEGVESEKLFHMTRQSSPIPFDIFQISFEYQTNKFFFETIRMQHSTYFMEAQGEYLVGAEEANLSAQLVTYEDAAEQIIEVSPYFEAFLTPQGRLIFPFDYRGHFPKELPVIHQDYMKMQLAMNSQLFEPEAQVMRRLEGGEQPQAEADEAMIKELFPTMFDFSESIPVIPDAEKSLDELESELLHFDEMRGESAVSDEEGSASSSESRGEVLQSDRIELSESELEEIDLWVNDLEKELSDE